MGFIDQSSALVRYNIRCRICSIGRNCAPIKYGFPTQVFEIPLQIDLEHLVLYNTFLKNLFSISIQQKEHRPTVVNLVTQVARVYS